MWILIAVLLCVGICWVVGEEAIGLVACLWPIIAPVVLILNCVVNVNVTRKANTIYYDKILIGINSTIVYRTNDNRCNTRILEKDDKIVRIPSTETPRISYVTKSDYSFWWKLGGRDTDCEYTFYIRETDSLQNKEIE